MKARSRFAFITTESEAAAPRSSDRSGADRASAVRDHCLEIVPATRPGK